MGDVVDLAARFERRLRFRPNLDPTVASCLIDLAEMLTQATMLMRQLAEEIERLKRERHDGRAD